MTASLHGCGIKVIIDIVPSHTSNRHAWFREALAAPKGSRARDRYIFRDGQGPDSAQPPSDWTSVFGGPAWTRVPDGQWYLHLFAAEQPDLNWANREVRDDFLTTLRFWSDRGADGFRVDVAHGLAKNLAEPLEPLTRNAKVWLLSNGTSPELDRGLGLRRARAATLLMLALPGSVYLYQGEELGLHEVAEIPAERIADPAFLRSGGAGKGRDGCRVPLPWTADGPSFGSGAGPAHLPQPAWFGPLSVQAQEHDPASTLALYRQALSWRRKLQAAESLEGMPATNGQVLHFGRPGGWRSVTNFGSRPVPVPRGTVVVASGPLRDGLLPADTIAWIIPAGHRFPGVEAPEATSSALRVLAESAARCPTLRARPAPGCLPRGAGTGRLSAVVRWLSDGGAHGDACGPHVRMGGCRGPGREPGADRHRRLRHGQPGPR